MRADRPPESSEALAAPRIVAHQSEPLTARPPVGEFSRPDYRQIDATLAGRYTIERELGGGAMATVYLAHDVRHRRHVAIKVLYEDLSRELRTERFLREITIAAGLRHPHIVPLYDSGEAGGHLYYIMPYVEGESLRQRLERDGQLSMSDGLAIARDVAEALDCAHAHGIVHRDIKPDNILLEGGHAVVADFGVAWAIEAAGTERLTGSGLRVGTPAYMSPEQGTGDARIDGRSDVYALACVVYEMLAGEVPYTGSSAQAVLAKHLQAPVPNLRLLRPAVSPEMQQVLEAALAKVPADRFASAGEFVRALEASASGAARSVSLRRTAIIAGVAVVALTSAVLSRTAGLKPFGGHSPSGATDESPRIAVMYFDDLTRDSAFAHVADGLTENLIQELSGVNAFRVVSRNGVKPYRGRRVPFDSVVAALRVNTVIDGRIRRAGDRVRVAVDLVDARSNAVVDSLSLERPLPDFIALEREVAREVAAALRRRMGREVRLRGATSGTNSRRAKEFLLKARRARDDAEVLAEQPHPEDLRTAVEALQRADSFLALAQRADPRWIRAVVDRGWTAYQRSRLTTGAARIATLRQALGYAEEAVRRAPGSAEALELRGTVHWQFVRELQGSGPPTAPDPERMRKAEGDLRAAVDRDSTLATAWATLSYVLSVKGSTAEAVIAAQRALREDAYLAGARDVFLQLFHAALMLGDFEQAGEWCQRGRLSSPADWRFVECELTLLRHNPDATPQPVRAWALVDELERLDPAAKAKAAGRQYHTIYRRVVAATISARTGRHDIARAEIARAIRATQGDTSLRLDLAYDEAYLRLVLGEPDRATELLRGLLNARPVLRPLLARDPLFRNLRLPE
jgi:serine/threonine protein kinase/tetratricopeptide (TPR) repeat protein